MCDNNVSPKSWSDFTTVKLAAAQVTASDDSLDKVIQYINRAGSENAQLIALPEYMLGPVTIPSKPTEKIAEAAAKNNIYVVVGAWEELCPGAYERKQKDGFANTALVFDRAGQIIGRYNKTHRAVGDPPHGWPPKGDEDEWLMKHGEGYPTFQLDFARIGIMTCYDGYFPESALSLSLNGAEIVIWINGRDTAVEDYIVKTDMFRNYCSMITTNQGMGSGTMIAAWPNVILAHVTQTGDHYISADMDLEKLRLCRAKSRTHHQRRPEIYHAITKHHEPWKVYE